ncbi:uncharacterized protein LOC134201002 [Bombyx mori]|uniref:uncharacterized protein LOC134201002 n=1 Tax=Bombyx mori TaxID=7091 RepID=UPI002ED2CD46
MALQSAVGRTSCKLPAPRGRVEYVGLVSDCETGGPRMFSGPYPLNDSPALLAQAFDPYRGQNPDEVKGLPRLILQTDGAAHPKDARPTEPSKALKRRPFRYGSPSGRPDGAAGVPEYPAGPEPVCRVGTRFTANGCSLTSRQRARVPVARRAASTPSCLGEAATYRGRDVRLYCLLQPPFVQSPKRRVVFCIF